MTDPESAGILSDMPEMQHESLSEFFDSAAQTGNQLLNTKPTPIPFLFKDLGIVKGTSTILTAPIGSMKSFLSLWLSGQIVANNPKCRVLYVDKENTLASIQARARAMFNDMEEEALSRLIFWCEMPNAAKEHVPPDFHHGLKFYQRVAKEWGPDTVIVFDTLNRFFQGDENSVKDTSFVTNSLVSIRNAPATVISLHQVGKPSHDTGKFQTYRGSSELGGGCDHALTLKNFKQINNHSASFTAHCFKTRWLPMSDRTWVHDRGAFYQLQPDCVVNPNQFFDLRSGITRYLIKSPGARVDEIVQTLNSNKNGSFPQSATRWMLANCCKNYWMQLKSGNAFIYKNIPLV